MIMDHSILCTQGRMISLNCAFFLHFVTPLVSLQSVRNMHKTTGHFTFCNFTRTLKRAVNTRIGLKLEKICSKFLNKTWLYPVNPSL